MSKSAFPGLTDKGPAVCLDAWAYARRVFGTDDGRWFETPVLLANGRQVLASLRPQWLLFPLREWVDAWWIAQHPDAPGAARSLRSISLRVADSGLRAALVDALRALHTITAPGCGLALQVDGPEQWLAEANAQQPIDEGDAEDVVVHVAALLHALAGSGIAAVLVRQSAPTGSDLAERYAALANAAAHHGWATVLCCRATQDLPEGFDAVALAAPGPGVGRWLLEDDWRRDEPVAASFLVAQVPALAAPDDVLARIARWRAPR
jgi:hypothetical protein